MKAINTVVRRVSRSYDAVCMMGVAFGLTAILATMILVKLN